MSETTSVPRRRGDEPLSMPPDPSKDQEGEGGGGGGALAPAGYIERKGGRSRYVPIVHPTRMLALVLAASSARC